MIVHRLAEGQSVIAVAAAMGLSAKTIRKWRDRFAAEDLPGLGVRSLPDIRVGEVISVVARRRRWTLEQKLALVEAVSQPGASVASVSDRHGVSRSLVFEWRRQAREGTMPGMLRMQAPAALVAVRVVEDGPPKQAPPSCAERPGTDGR